MEPIGCTETSVRKCDSTLRKIPEERSSHLHRGGSVMSRMVDLNHCLAETTSCRLQFCEMMGFKSRMLSDHCCITYMTVQNFAQFCGYGEMHHGDQGIMWTLKSGEIFRTCPDWPWGPPSLLYNGYRVFPRGRKRPGRDAVPSPPSSAEV
jgi:hypothetical protein